MTEKDTATTGISRVESVAPSTLKPSPQHVKSSHEKPGEPFVTSVENNGIVVPLQGREEDNDLRLLDGVRRARAAVAAGLETIPVLVRDCNDAAATAISLKLNSPAGVPKSVTDADREASVTELAARTGRSESEVRLELGLWSTADHIEHALGNVDGVGRAVAESLADQFDSLEAVREASRRELAVAQGVGSVTARAIRHEFALREQDGPVLTDLDDHL